MEISNAPGSIAVLSSTVRVIEPGALHLKTEFTTMDSPRTALEWSLARALHSSKIYKTNRGIK
jgi:hypothetical protein